MDLASILKIIGAAVFSAGGIGAIIVAVVKFTSNHISEKMLKKYDAKLKTELERYKSELEMEAEKYRTKSERITYVTQRQFDTEFVAYQSIFNNLHIFAVSTAQLFPTFDQVPADEKAKKEMYTKRYEEYCDAFNAFSDTLEKNAPFIPKANYELFVDLRQRAHELGCMFPDIRIIDDPVFREDHSKIARENYKKTREFQDCVAKAKDQIREYLSTLKVEKEQSV